MPKKKKLSEDDVLKAEERFFSAGGQITKCDGFPYQEITDLAEQINRVLADKFLTSAVNSGNRSTILGSLSIYRRDSYRRDVLDVVPVDRIKKGKKIE